MTYTEAKALNIKAVILSIDEDTFYALCAESNAANDYAFTAQLCKAQSDARRSRQINY